MVVCGGGGGGEGGRGGSGLAKILLTHTLDYGGCQEVRYHPRGDSPPSPLFW